MNVPKITFPEKSHSAKNIPSVDYLTDFPSFKMDGTKIEYIFTVINDNDLR